MESVRVERLDHLGLIASVINDLGLVSMVDARLQPDDQEEIPPGEALKEMILNGLGFAHRPLSLSPPFFANKPLDLLFRPGVDASLFNRFKLGRTLDEVHTYGCDLLFSEVALAVCRQETIDQRFSHLDTPRYQGLELCHDGMAQRWLVGSSEAAMERAQTSVSRAQKRELDAIDKPLFPLPAKRFATPESAQAALATRAGSWRYHQVANTELFEQKRYAGKGRPSATTPVKAIEWPIQAQVGPETEAIRRHQQHKGCFVLGPNLEADDLGDEEVIAAYKAQSQVENGFRFLKDPLFFVSSLFVKKPSRIQGRLMVMTLALLVYSVAQRRVRQALARQKESLPNQIHQPTQRPTLRWVFQLLEGINRVRLIVQDHVHDLIEGSGANVTLCRLPVTCPTFGVGEQIAFWSVEVSDVAWRTADDGRQTVASPVPGLQVECEARHRISAPRSRGSAVIPKPLGVAGYAESSPSGPWSEADGESYRGSRFRVHY